MDAYMVTQCLQELQASQFWEFNRINVPQNSAVQVCST